MKKGIVGLKVGHVQKSGLSNRYPYRELKRTYANAQGRLMKEWKQFDHGTATEDSD